MTSTAPALSAVPSTLRIPLAARALGARLFPNMAVDDRYAAAALARMGDDGAQWLQDRQSVYGTLARTQVFRATGQAFLARHPHATVANLGCGLSDYLQWLDNGDMQMIDADLPEVMTIRRELSPARHARHRLLELDLTAADWWDALGLPTSRDADPVMLMSEGVFMYLQPDTVTAVLQTFAERAPAGSVFTFDAMCWLSIGRAKQHNSVKHTDAQFHWGPRRENELNQLHPRLHLAASQQVMGDYNLFYRCLQPLFKALTGVPLYAIYRLEVSA